jgi:acetolactate synthase I/III small subunit
MSQIITLHVNDLPGVLARVAGLFSRRGYNIDTLMVAPSEEPGMSRMTITTSCSQATYQQMMKQLDKLIDVVRIQNVSETRTTS